MGKLLAHSLLRTIIIVIIVSLLLAGAVYAYQTIWSGKADITIIGPAAMGELEVTDVIPDADGSWSAGTKTWAVSIVPNGDSHLKVYFRNTGGDTISFLPYANGNEIKTVYSTDSVFVQATGDRSLAAGESGSLTFRICAYPYAEPGALPKIDLELRQY